MYSNGYYFTTFPTPAPSYTQAATQQQQPCYSCSCSCQGSLQWTFSQNQTA